MPSTNDPTVNFPTGGGTSLTFQVPNYAAAVKAAKAISSNLSSEFSAGTITTYTYDGSTPYNAPTTNNLLVLDAGAQSVNLTTGTSAVLVNEATPVFINGGSNANVDLVAQSNLVYVMNTGTGRIVADGDSNSIFSQSVGGGNHSIYLGASSQGAFVGAFSGNDTIYGASGTGGNEYTLGIGNNVVFSTGADLIDNYNPGDGVTPGGTDIIDAHTNVNSDTVIGGLNNLLFVNGKAASSLEGDQGSDTVFAGAGGGVYSAGTAGKSLLIGGCGAVTLTGGGSGDILVAGGSKGDVLTAGAGNETLVGGFSQGADTISAGSGNDLVIGGLGHDTVVAGTGNATIAGGVKSSLFDFVDGSAGGKDILASFASNSGNKIGLVGYGSNEEANAIATQKNYGYGTVLTLSDNTQITLLNVSKVTTSNFA